MTEQNPKTMRPAELAKELRSYVAGENHTYVAIVDEMQRRLEEVDDCICWGVDCVHQAKELDRSYGAFAAAERAQVVLDNPNNVNHAPFLRAALVELIAACKKP